MMKTILLSAFCLYSLILHAQDKSKTSKEPGESISIKLSKYPIADFPNKSVPVSDIRIAQFVSDSVIVGYALKGTDNYVVNLKITKPLTDLLQDHIYKMYKNDFKKDGIKMLWVLKELRLGEKVGFLEYSYARVNIDGYISADGILFTKACSLDTVYVSESGGDVSKWHGDDIEKAFSVFSKRVLQFAGNTHNIGQQQKTVQEILNQSYQNSNVPILTATVYNEGIYKNFGEFLQNKPSVTDYQTTVIDKNIIKFTNKNTAGTVDTVDMWGICKSGEIYKYYKESLIPIEKQGTGFIVSDFIKNSNKRNRNVAFFSLMGGIAGGIIGGAAVGLAVNAVKNKLILVESIPYINKPAKQPVASCINMETGEFSF
jgi:hypothetical protein